MARPLSERLPGVATATGTVRELTIDQLAAAAKMTVRNVRAYAGRGLIPAPRLVGRTGYYGKEHVDRLLLIRDLLDRGYTLAAVEEALEKNHNVSPSHALDLIGLLADPLSPQEPEVITREELARLAGVQPNADFVEELVAVGLAEPLGEDRLRLPQPGVVRAGAQAVALGLSRESVLAMLPFLSERMAEISERFVQEVLEHLWEPFVEDGMPEERWPEMSGVIEQLLPVAGQAVMAIFRQELSRAIEARVGSEITRLTDT